MIREPLKISMLWFFMEEEGYVESIFQPTPSLSGTKPRAKGLRIMPMIATRGFVAALKLLLGDSSNELLSGTCTF